MKQIEQKLDSREVAEMMEIQHKHLLEKIDGINKDLVAENSSTKKYWEETTFEYRGQSFRNFLITKRGCEFLAHKTTGTKGNLFTDRYMDRFEEMKDYIEQGQAPKQLSPLQQLQLQSQAILEVNDKIDNLEKNLPLLGVDCDEITKTVKSMGAKLLGYKSIAYKNKSLRSKVYSDIYSQLKREFQVRSYKAIKRCQLDKAIEIINNYSLPFELSNQISLLNSQVSFEN